MKNENTKPGVIIDDRFLLKQHLGGGGSAAVWRAVDLQTNKPLALKLLHPHFRENTEVRARLMREAMLLSNLRHENIALAFQLELERIQPYFVMELLEGDSLEDIMGDRASVGEHFTFGEILAVFEPICSALQYAHQKGVIHRDLKPSNVMIVEEKGVPTVKVLDFGLAKLEDFGPGAATTQGRVFGTIYYMSPEQARGDAIDARCDVFSLGVILFEMLTLRRAWLVDPQGEPIPAFVEPLRRGRQNTLNQVLQRLTSPERPRPCALRPELPPAIDALLERALALDPASRPPNAERFLEEIHEATQEGTPAAATLALQAVVSPRTGTLARAEERERTRARSQQGESNPEMRFQTRPLPDPEALSVPTRSAYDPVRPASSIYDESDEALARTKIEDNPRSPIVDPAIANAPTRDAGLQERFDSGAGATAVSAPMADPANVEKSAFPLPNLPKTQAVERTKLLESNPEPGRAPLVESSAASFSSGLVRPVSNKPSWIAVAILVALVANGVILAALLWNQRSKPAPPVAKIRLAPAPQPNPPPVRPSVAPSAPPAPPAPPVESPEPVPIASTPKRVRPSKSPRPKTRSAPPPSRAEKRLLSLRTALKSARQDPEKIMALGQKIEAVAKLIEDRTVRARIQRIARSSAMVGDFEGVERALRELEAALK